MTPELSDFAARLRGFIPVSIPVAADVRRLNSISELKNEPPNVVSYDDFDSLARELFALQFTHNPAYRRLCEARRASPQTIAHWSQIPAVPTAAFKELELTCLPVKERTAVFHSSGTTEQRPSRHFHSAESLAVYEASSLAWFRLHVVGNGRLLILTPAPTEAPSSSLVHMFETLRRESGSPESVFVGRTGNDCAWTIDFDAALAALHGSRRRAEADSLASSLSPPPHVGGYEPLLVLGTAFSFVHLLDFLAEQNLQFQLPWGSRVMETGGYKGRSRSLPKAELHALITEGLGVPASYIVCEYGMSELSSQAYDGVSGVRCDVSGKSASVFRFPSWARSQIISPETGREVSEGKTGLIRVFDLANVFSVMAIQTEDLGIRRGDGFELVGRAAMAKPRGCSLMAV